MLNQSMFVLGRAARDPAVHATASVASIPVAVAGLHAVGFSPSVDLAAVSAGLFDVALWLTLAIVAVFGALGGVVAELSSLHGNIELPHRVRRLRTAKRSRLADPRYEIDLGIVSRLILGATAAIALLAVFAPTTPLALVVNALIAGSAATGVFRLVQGRLLGGAPAAAQPNRRSAWISSVARASGRQQHGSKVSVAP